VILSAHQPAYLPWLGYFEKIARCDVFIYLDSVQFEKGSFTNRNKIKTANGPIMLTIPLKLQGYKDFCVGEIQVDNSQNWREKHLKSIYLSYKKAPNFDERYSKLEKLYSQKNELLGEICFSQLLFWLNELGINKKIIRSSTLDIESKKSDLILDLCKKFKANHYLSGALGRDYLKETEFAESNIEVEYQDFKHPIYKQLHGPFEPYMGIVDFWMNSEGSGLIFEKKAWQLVQENSERQSI
jgi:hypothetical protein